MTDTTRDDLVKRLTIKAGVMEMGEGIAWGSDTALMREAAAHIEKLEAKLAKAQWLLCDASVQLREGKIKTRRNRANLIDKFLSELKGQDDE